MSISQTTSRPEDVTPSLSTPEPGALQMIGPIGLLAAAAVVALLAALLLWAPPKPPLASLTAAGIREVKPEHDVTVYLAAGLAFMGLVAALASRRGFPRQSPRNGGGASSQAALQFAGTAGAVLTAVLVFIHARGRLPGGPRILPWELALLTLAAVACTVAGYVAFPGRPQSPTTDMVDDALAPLRRRVADIFIPLAVVAIVYMPTWRNLAGYDFAVQEFFHIDFFAMAPALAFKKGVALGTTLHPFYGVGWAIALAKLPLLRIGSYGQFIRLEVVYGCIYFIAVYALLRLLVGSWQWAASGTVVAIVLQMFGSFPTVFVMWQLPSATVLRWAFDVWFFLACVLYVRTRRPGWMVLGGLIVGLAALFQTDTGMYLGLSAAFFWVCLWRLHPAQGRKLIRVGAAAAACGISVLVVGLGIASRGTLLSGDFWNGWTENLRISMAGGTLRPMTGMTSPRLLLFFALMMSTYLIVGGYTVACFVHRRMTPTLVVLGTISVYGFLTLLYFVGRSDPWNLFRPAVPFAIVLAGCGGAVHARPRASDRDLGRHRKTLAVAVRALPSAALAVALTMLALHPGFRSYPSLAKTAFTGTPPNGFCVLHNPDDICGLDASRHEHVGQLHAAADRLRAIGAPTRQVAILDTTGAILYTLADARPWGRYQPLFQGLFFKDMVHTVVSDLETSPPDIVVMRSREDTSPAWADLWQAMRPTVEHNYILDSRYGPFEIWQRRIDGGTANGGIGSNP